MKSENAVVNTQTCVASKNLTEQEQKEEINILARFFGNEYFMHKQEYICWRLFIPKATSYYNFILERSPK